MEGPLPLMTEGPGERQKRWVGGKADRVGELLS